MLYPQLVILGYSGASMFLRASPKPNVSTIISIHGQREFGVEGDVAHRLDLHFDDTEVAMAHDAGAMQRLMSRRRWNEQNGLIEVAPALNDAEAIIQFARSVRETDGIVLCHCGAGMSRAPAAALICLATWLGEGSEEECAAEILRLRRGAVPHVGLVQFADQLLGRGGRLVEALRLAGRNA
jgi:predicted protein tyrosine phosphatase